MDFRRDIQPILSNHCFPCHGPDAAERKANLRLDRLDDLDGLPEGILIPEHPESSAIIHRVLSQDPAKEDAATRHSPRVELSTEKATHAMGPGGSSVAASLVLHSTEPSPIARSPSC